MRKLCQPSQHASMRVRSVGLMRGRILIVAIAVVTGCSKPVTVREPVYVERVVYVPIARALTQPISIPEPRNDSGDELLRVARARKAALQQCNADKGAIGAIQGTPVP